MTTTQSRPSTDLVRPSIRDRAAHAAVRAPGLLESLGRRLVLTALSRIPQRNVRLIDNQGSHETKLAGEPGSLPLITVRVLDPRFYAAAAFGGSLGIAESYIDGAWEMWAFACDRLIPTRPGCVDLYIPGAPSQ